MSLLTSTLSMPQSGDDNNDFFATFNFLITNTDSVNSIGWRMYVQGHNFPSGYNISGGTATDLPNGDIEIVSSFNGVISAGASTTVTLSAGETPASQITYSNAYVEVYGFPLPADPPEGSGQTSSLEDAGGVTQAQLINACLIGGIIKTG